MRRYTLAAVAAAILAIPATAGAAEWRTIAGVQYFSDSVWTNQLDAGEPVAEFPKGCRGSKCAYRIRVEYLTERECWEMSEQWENQAGPSCSYDGCAAWIELGNVTPLRSPYGRESFGLQADGIVPFASNMPVYDFSLPTTEASFTPFTLRGRSNQMLTILAWELELTEGGEQRGDDRELCRFGVAASYHPNSKTVFDRGLLLPR